MCSIYQSQCEVVVLLIGGIAYPIQNQSISRGQYER